MMMHSVPGHTAPHMHLHIDTHIQVHALVVGAVECFMHMCAAAPLVHIYSLTHTCTPFRYRARMCECVVHLTAHVVAAFIDAAALMLYIYIYAACELFK